MHKLTELISDNTDIREFCLTAQHAYPGCSTGGTLFHCLCDFPSLSADEKYFMQCKKCAQLVLLLSFFFQVLRYFFLFSLLL
jgi:hypothetical protein